MKTLRRLIRQIILEGPVKDTFDEAWFNVVDERPRHQFDPEPAGTMHKDQLKKAYSNPEWFPNASEDIEILFKEKRDLKRLWNEVIEANGLRSFWEGPKMKYFHSLSYYGSPSHGTDKMQTGQIDDEGLQDLTAYGFFQEYDKTGNKDEMSTYGIYSGKHQIPKHQTKFGVIISGRVTLATMQDAFTESRSKASDKDIAAHASSGMPKRIMPTDDMIQSLLFEEKDIMEFGKIGECIIDNWSIEAIVCRRGIEIKDAAEKLARQFSVPLIWSSELGRRV